MRNEFSDFVVDDLRKGRSMAKNKWKVDDVESFKKRTYIVQESEYGPSESEATGERMRHYSLKSSIKSSIDEELPKLVVFLQETNYGFVKDICIDKVVTSREKCFEENCDTENGCVPSTLKYKVEESEGESTEESEDLDSSISSTESTWIVKKDLFNEVDEKQKVHSGAIGEINEKVVPKLYLDRKVTGKRVAASTNSVAISLAKILDENKHRGKGVAGSNIEQRSVFCNSGLSAITIGGGGSGCGWTGGYGQCHDCGSTSAAEGYAPKNQTKLYRSHFGFVYQCEGGSSAVDPAFSTVRRPSLSSYLSSASLRSNSSTNSSHSFAFPILQAEWNGSPVRMASAVLVRTRWQQLWRLCLPCCNFLASYYPICQCSPIFVLFFLTWVYYHFV